MKHMYTVMTLAVSSVLFMESCKPEPSMPKPRGYFKIDLPEEHAYKTFDSAGFPFRFEYPVYGKVVQDLNLIKEENQRL